MSQAIDLCLENAGYVPENAGEEVFLAEETAIVALACACIGMEEQSASLLSVLYGYQLNNGGLPETNTAGWTDASGTAYKNVSRTAAAAWYAIACAGENPFTVE